MDKAQVYVDPLLTRASVRFTNPNFIAERVFPRLQVDKRTGFYFVYDKENLRVADSRRTAVSRANRVDHNLVREPYGPLIEHSLEHAIEYDVAEQFDNPIEPRTDATLVVTEKVQLAKEKELATLMANPAIITQNVTLAGTSQWSDQINSDPFADIQTAIDVIRREAVVMPNTLILGYHTWARLRHHPDLLERVKYTSIGSLTNDLLADLFQVPNVLIGSAVEVTSREGLPVTSDYVWGRHAWLAYVNPNPAIRNVTAGYHLQMKGFPFIDRWDEKEVKAEFVRYNDYFEPRVVAREAIYLIRNAVA